MKKFFEKHDLVKIVFGMILLTAVLTWIVPQADFSTGELVKGEITRIGLFDFGTYGLLGMYYFTVLVMFIIVVGVFYQFLSKLNAYQELTDSLARKIKGKEIIFSLIVSFIFAALASIVNEYIVLFAFVPFIITLCSKAGMDKISSFVATFGAILVGVLGSTISTKVVGMNVNYFGLKYTDFLLEKILFFVVIFVAYSVFNILYLRKNVKKATKKVEIAIKEETVVKEVTKTTAKKATAKKAPAKKAATKKTATKKATKASLAKSTDVKVVKVDKETIVEKTETLTEDMFANKVDGNKKCIIPLIVVAVLTILTIILAYIPWVTVFEVDWFTNATNWLLKEVKLFDVPIFSYILGSVQEFGSWDLFGAQVVMLIAMFVLAICYRTGVNAIIESFTEGFKKVSKLIGILLLCYVVLEFAVMFPVIPTIIGEILGTKFNVLTTGLAGIITNLFTVEYQYTANLVYSNFTALYANDMNVVSMILQYTFGFVSFFAPSSALLFVGLSYLDIPYKNWMKYIWKFLILALVAVIAIAFIIA